MFDEYDPLFCPRPFWFANAELLTKALHAEIKEVTQVLASNSNVRKLLDTPEATIPERSTCFVLLAHRELISVIDDTFVSRYEPSPFLDDLESDVLKRTADLVRADAPSWVQEMRQVVEQLPVHICASLPEPLQEERFDDANPEKKQAIESAIKTLESVEAIQAWTGRVLDEQLRRLVGRWSAGTVQVQVPGASSPKGRRIRRTRDKQRAWRDKLIADIDDVAQTVVEFVKLMDERKVPPLPTWKWPGSWVKAYADPHLRKLIHQDKSRALTRASRTKR